MPRRASRSSQPPHALRRIREARGLSRAELGRRAGFSESHVVKLERGEARLHVDDLAAFAAALECEPADLVRLEAAPPEPTDSCSPPRSCAAPRTADRPVPMTSSMSISRRSESRC
ncbi:MAG: helix-turn-helix transcriptional regulator [Alphaproteobacteria bacterium]|nr:helix-turn-helix transcriptional regulator [Alphaproteobacteria bacterium]